MKLYLFLMITMVASCTHLLRESKDVNIQIEKGKSLDSWIITYKIPHDVYALVFDRQGNHFRQKNWEVVTPGLQIETIQDMVVIKSKSGERFREVRIKHNSYFKPFQKDYEFFIKYSGFDRLIYLGHYSIFPMENKDEKIDYESKFWKKKFKTEYSFKLKSSEKIIIDGVVHHNSLVNWVDLKSKGTYVFWGEQHPVEKQNLIILTDKNVPYWIEADVNKYLPKIFEFLEKKFDLALNFKPVIYLNFEKTTKKRLRNKGGTLPGLIQLTFKGSDWKIKNKESKEWLFWFLAHEATHLWNGQLLRYSSSKHAWMHEGSADAFASRVLRHFGLIDDNTFIEYIKKSKIKCLNGLESGIALIESSKLRKFGNYYDCGHLIAQMTEQSLKKEDLFNFYRALFLVKIDFFEPRIGKR